MIFETFTLITAVILFSWLERRRQGYPINRRRDLPLNIMALVISIIVGELCKLFIVDAFDALEVIQSFSFKAVRNLPGPAKIAFGIMLSDFSLYWVHRAMHGNQLLWRTHTFHHSLEDLWWLSGSRTSVTHLFLFAVPQTFIGYYLLKLASSESAVAFSFGIVVNLWIHTNIRVSLGPLDWLIITPNYHRVHHGARLSRNNLGFVLTLWDRIFGTYVNPQKIGRDFKLGSVSTEKALLKMIIGV